jgi:DNA-binding CsgD family transcriptional regulator
MPCKGPKPSLTALQIKKIVALRVRNLTIDEIAKGIGCSRGLVWKYCKLNGLTKPRRPKLTEDEIEQIGVLRAKNYTRDAIAAEIGCSVGSVEWCCLMHGFEASKPPRFRTTRPKPCIRNGHVVRPYTPEDDAELLALEAQGKRYAEIARVMGRKINSIKGRLCTLARREAWLEAA